MNLFKLITVIATVIIFTACSNSNKVQKTDDDTQMGNPGKVLQIDPLLQNGKTINLNVNDKFDVTFLHECVACSEVWTITNIDKNKIGEMESTYKNGPKKGGIGGSRDHIFHFIAKEKGVSTLSFSYFEDKRSITFDVK